MNFTASIMLVVVLWVFGAPNAFAAEAKADAAEAKKAKPFTRVPVLHTKYTRRCPERFGLTKEPKETSRRGYTLDPRNYKRLLKVQEALVEERYDDALEMLKALEEVTKSREYDFAMVNQNLNHVYSLQGNYKMAIKHLKIAMDMNVFSGQRLRGITNNLARLYLQQKEFGKAIELLEEWFKTAVNPTSQDYINLAYAYAQSGKTVEAICPTRLAINFSEEKPKQQLFDLLLAMHWEQKDYAGSVNILKENIQYYPDTKKLWMNLAGAYGQLNKPKDALAAWELAYKQNMFEKETEYRSLYSYYNLLEVPYKAAEVLQAEIENGKVESNEKNWRSVANSWHVAKEIDKALYAYGKAAGFSEDGELYIRQGELFSDIEKWDEAIDAFERGLAKGGLEERKKGVAMYRMGIAYFNKGELNQARQTLKKATTYESHKKYAQSWMNYIDDWEKQQKLFKTES